MTTLPAAWALPPYLGITTKWFSRQKNFEKLSDEEWEARLRCWEIRQEHTLFTILSDILMKILFSVLSLILLNFLPKKMKWRKNGNYEMTLGKFNIHFWKLSRFWLGGLTWFIIRLEVIWTMGEKNRTRIIQFSSATVYVWKCFRGEGEILKYDVTIFAALWLPQGNYKYLLMLIIFYCCPIFR